MPEIVPFGKYKGQPIDALAQDKEYCEWLRGQDWFRTRYTSIHTLIINNFGAPAETPEHNALQAMFLCEEWAKYFIVAAIGEDEIQQRFQKHTDGWIKQLQHHIQRLQENHDRAHAIADEYGLYDLFSSRYSVTDKEAARLLDFLTTELNEAKTSFWAIDLHIKGLAFECGGTDVRFETNTWARPDLQYRSLEWKVECKPTLGDDYPAVLRQMKANNDNALLLGEGGYSGVGATFDQVRQIFATSKIKIVCLSEVLVIMEEDNRDAGG